MKTAVTDQTSRTPLRLWPGVVLAVLTVFCRWGVPVFLPDAQLFAVLSGGVGALLILLWWVFFSRAPWLERLGAIVVMVGGMYITPRFLHPSVATGNMGFQFYLYAIPIVSIALVLWAVATRGLQDGARRLTMVAALLLACGVFTLFRSDGLTGDGAAEFELRWTRTPEERLLAESEDEPVSVAGASLASEAEWPGLRGPNRDGVIPGVRIETDWTASPPVELWRRAVGPGVSSFAVAGDRIYTQEQRGEDEVVTCYSASTGEPVWRHRDASRFYDSHVGAGPRATPAFSDGRVYTFGANGILNALDAEDGSVVWSRNAASDTDAKVPYFGLVSSPLVVDDLVIVHTDALVAYDIATGELRWTSPKSGGSYSSPHQLTIDGVEQIVLLGDRAAMGVSPKDGMLLWEDEWEGIGIVQPVMTSDGDLLVSMVNNGAMPIGMRRLSLSYGANGWSASERWMSGRLRPSFSAFVVHEGYAYGIDGKILASIDVADGTRKWKGGRYGAGQVMLLPDQDLLLVVTERGELALVSATPDGFSELARFPAIEGKTWSQPALVNDLLLVRNGEEMAAFRLALASG